MDLQDFPMDVQRCPITIESCECSLIWFYLISAVRIGLNIISYHVCGNVLHGISFSTNIVRLIEITYVYIYRFKCEQSSDLEKP